MIFAILKQYFLYSEQAKQGQQGNLVFCSGTSVKNGNSLKPNFIYLLSSVFILCFTLAIPAHARVLNQESTETGNFKAEFLYQALAAEIYREMGDEVLAVEQYQHLALESRDPAIARRVTILAAATGQLPKGLKVAERWVALTPDDLEARQYLALLYLRNNKIKLSSAQFHTIHELVEETFIKNEGSSDKQEKQELVKHSQKTSLLATKVIKKVQVSQGLTFIGSVLAAETHRDKAYRVFAEYTKEHKSKIYYRQQKLIAANLALKAKNYKAVIVELENIKGLDSQNLVDAMSMKAKALHKLNRNPEAINVLMSIKDNPMVSDSSKLELVRLFVLQKQKKKALPILEKLIVKHEKNYDLLKSLIALQIDQRQLTKAEASIDKLRASKSYLHDADYFSGEVLQTKGNLKEALSYYEKVSGGSFLRNAHQKAIFITKETQGNKGLSRYFEKKYKASKDIINKAYWSKLRADSSFSDKDYPQALVYYNQAIKLSPLNPRYYYRRGLLHERMRKLDFAEKDFNQVLSISKNDADALNALGYMLSVNTKRLDEAKTYIRKAHQIKPHDPLIMDSLGFVHFKSGDLTEAEKYLRKAFKLIKDPEVASHLISVLAENDKQDEALRLYQEMTEKYPNNKVLHEAKQYLQN
ncbi:tetratricopeptide repeat protein [uncultured Cocleimonas sp.]|uniref:tetratricopeptide repeat protein n=1 Tax=uncultured Cocleimonas sp. TaxID=1051587 RepID=UPI002615E875|nr:tetratricopeptide repeat protein [uncultured Cocleimonas sp.]